ncbi:exportin 1 [Cryptosporidium felis]|nr:exportin 1 [Cryptosporidium felis]
MITTSNENLHIYSGNISSLVGSYLSDIYLNDYNQVDTDESIELFEGVRSKSSTSRSIAILDSDFEKIIPYVISNEPKGLINGTQHPIENNELKFMDDPNQIVDNISNKFLWKGRIDIFEQSINKNKHLAENKVLNLKKLFGEKNVHRLKTNFTKNEGDLGNLFNSHFFSSSLQIDDILESIRHKLESTDQNRTINITSDLNSIFGSVTAEILEFLHDEAPYSHKPCFSLLPNNNPSEIDDHLVNKIKFFVNTEFLLNQSKECDHIWFLEFNYIENLIKSNRFITENPLEFLVFVIDQVNALNPGNYNISSDPLSTLGSSVNHPFRNIGIVNISPENEVNLQTHFDKFLTIESFCSSNYLDICQSGYCGINSLEKSEIFFVVNQGYHIPNNLPSLESPLSNYVTTSSRCMSRRFQRLKYFNTYPQSIIHTICSIKKCKSLNDLLESTIKCKKDKKYINFLRTHFNLEDEEINSTFEQTMILLEN